MFHLLQLISLLVGERLGLVFSPETSVRNQAGADESDNSGALDPQG